MARKYFGKCDVVDCDKPAKAGTYCHMHYARIRRHNRLDKDAPINKGKTCSVEGCETPAKVRGMCGMHGARNDRWGSPFLGAREIKTNPCIVGGCSEIAKCKGLCNKHYTNYTYHQDKNGEGYSIQHYVGERSIMSSGSTLYNITCDIFPKFTEAAYTESGENTFEFEISYQTPYTGQPRRRTALVMSAPPSMSARFYADVIATLKSSAEMTKFATYLMESFLKQDWDELLVEKPEVKEILELIRTNTYRYDINVTGPASQN